MGYDTRFKLGMYAEKYEDVEKLLENEKMLHSIYLNKSEPFKWYNRHQDMIDYSLKYPKVIFILLGEGEEIEDKWKLWTKNGKQIEKYAEIVIKWPKLDLKEIE